VRQSTLSQMTQCFEMFVTLLNIILYLVVSLQLLQNVQAFSFTVNRKLHKNYFMEVS